MGLHTTRRTCMSSEGRVRSTSTHSAVPSATAFEKLSTVMVPPRDPTMIEWVAVAEVGVAVGVGREVGVWEGG
jgi:hypothetical protein